MSPTTLRSKLENDVTAAVELAVLGAGGIRHPADRAAEGKGPAAATVSEPLPLSSQPTAR